MRHRVEILERQLVQEPIAEAAMEIFASVCVLARLDAPPHEAAPSEATGPEIAFATSATAGRLFLRQSARRIRQSLARLNDHDHRLIEETARQLLGPPARP